jgi:hypothetical protein
MGKLEPALARERLFAPGLFRIALRLEQTAWDEIAESPGETLFVLRSLQRLFGLNATYASFDTWLEAEAAGGAIVRDELGRVSAPPASVTAPPSVESMLAAPPLANAIEVVRRLALEATNTFTFATLSAGATLLDHLYGTPAAAASPQVIDHARRLSSSLVQAYCEAGADAIVLLADVASPDGADLELFAPVMNLAAYYSVPVILISRHDLSAAGVAVAAKIGIASWITPAQQSAGVVRLPPDGGPRGTGLALTAWEVDPETDPELIHTWRRALDATPV